MYRISCVIWTLLLCWPLSGKAEATSDGPPWEFDFGPIVSRQRDLHGTMRLRALGPFFERSSSEDGQTLTAVRPLFSRYTHPALERTRTEYLWPVASTKAFRDERSGRILLAFWTRFDVKDPESRYRFWLLPVYFQGRDADGETYAALFPLGGTIHEFLGRDKIEFVLFPLYAKTELKGVASYSYLWPIVGYTEGRGIYRFRVFPFYGQNRHRDRFNKKFVMWPIWTSAEYYQPGSAGYGYVLFPLWGRLKLDDQRSWMVLPPFFRVSRGDRVNLVLAPWPIFQRRTGEVRQTWLWPVWGQKHMRGTSSRFFLWPIVHQERIDRGDTIASRFYVLPFYYSEIKRERTHAPPPLQAGDPVPRGKMTANYQKLWPLVSYIREGEDVRMRMLDLWPLKQTPSIERNYAPLWTLWQHTRSASAADTEVLWGLYRRQHRAGGERYTSLFPLVDWSRNPEDEAGRLHWSVLKGLLGYEREGTNKQYRFLYLLRWNRNQENEP